MENMHLGYLIILLGFCCAIVCRENSTAYISDNCDVLEDQIFTTLNRGPKFINFKTIEEDLKIAFEYYTPFLHIPVKNRKESDQSQVGTLNINTGALVLTSIAVAAGLTVAGTMAYIGDIWTNDYTSRKSYREHISLQGENIWSSIGNIESIFNRHNIDLNSCLQKSICTLAKKAKKNVALRFGTSTDKIIDGIISSDWVLKKLSGTAVNDAIQIGKSEQSCSDKYSSCTVKEWSLANIIHNLIFA